MDTHKIIQSQYLVALAMFEQVNVNARRHFEMPRATKTKLRTRENIELDWVGIQTA